MSKYVYRHGRMVDKETGDPMVTGNEVCLPRMVRPIQEYHSPITGELITDRRQERDHMAKHGMVHTAEIRKPRKLKNERFIKKHGLHRLAE